MNGPDLLEIKMKTYAPFHTKLSRLFSVMFDYPSFQFYPICVPLSPICSSISEL